MSAEGVGGAQDDEQNVQRIARLLPGGPNNSSFPFRAASAAALPPLSTARLRALVHIELGARRARIRLSLTQCRLGRRPHTSLLTCSKRPRCSSCRNFKHRGVQERFLLLIFLLTKVVLLSQAS